MSLPEMISNDLEQDPKSKDGSVFVLIPEGEFEMGDGGDHDNPKHTVYLDAYEIGKYCVTNKQYAKFVEEMKGSYNSENDIYPDSKFWNKPEMANHPVTNVSWAQAERYAEWAGCVLPTEAQWEKAARGPNGYIYPWGNEWDETKCRNEKNRVCQTTAPVDAYPEGVSGYGTYQQAGNVWEWCFDWYDKDYYENPEAACNPRGPAPRPDHVFRGGAFWLVDESDFRCALRGNYCEDYRGQNVGFRLARKA